MKFKIFPAILLFFVISCASVSDRYTARQYLENGKLSDKKETKLGLQISAEEDSSMGSKYFGLVQVTLENRSQEWVKVKKVSIDFGSEDCNQNIKIVSGNEISTWYDATSKRNQISEYNRNLFLGALALAGTAAVAGSSKDGVKMAGAAGTLGAITALTVSDINKNLNRLEYAKIFPETHLMAGPFLIPPGLFAKKWVLLNTLNHQKTGWVDKFKMTYETETGEKETVKVLFRTNRNYGEWQNDVSQRYAN